MEIDYLPSIFLILFTLLTATWLTGLLTALFDLSWAKIKKLDPVKQRKLVEQSKHFLKYKRNYRIIIRFLKVVNLAIFSIVVFQFLNAFNLSQIGLLSAVICGLGAAAAYLLTTEVLGNGWLTSFNRLLISFSIPLLRIFFIVLNPFVRLIINLQRLISSTDNPDQEEIATTVDEIISLVEKDANQQPEKSVLEDSERQMIRGIFDLEETLVKEIMTPRVDLDAIKEKSTIDDVKKKIIESGHSRIPIYQDKIDEIVGLIFAKDLLDEQKIRKVKGLEELLHPPVFIPETKNVRELLQEFKENKKHIAVVLDEYGGTAGIVTFEDILEEIVGEIQDEYDTDKVLSGYVLQNDGTLIADGRMPIDEINELLKIVISKEKDFDTIGGYVTSELGRIPKTGDVIELKGLTVKILSADGRKVSKLMLTKQDEGVTARTEPG